jgi:diguanylate cyclase (GGDEF)-like protein
MRKERLTYQELAHKLLAGHLLQGDERRQAEDLLALGHGLEAGRRLGALLERLADRHALNRLARPEDRPGVRRFLDPASGDHWSIELPGPRPVTDGPMAAAPTAAAEKPPRPEPAPPAPVPTLAEKPRLVLPVEEVDPEPGVSRRFQDEGTGEPLRTLFATFAPCRTPDELGEALLPVREQIVLRTRATTVHFHLAGESAGELVPVPFRDEPLPRAAAVLGGRVAERVLGARRTLHVPNLAAPGAGGAPGESGALVSVPLISMERVVGLMEVRAATPGSFDPEELSFYSLAGMVAGAAVARAEVLEKLIYLDKLTGLYNRAYFDEQIEREIERANRTNTSVALLMADLDHFKRINDTQGHAAGDLALTHVSSLIRANVRQIDVAARYGGEEFAILLPTTSQARALSTAERLRRVVHASRAGEIIPALGNAKLSLSIGLALYPDDAATSRQLFDRADRVALYAAKNRGRNRVVSWADARGTREPLRPARES